MLRAYVTLTVIFFSMQIAWAQRPILWRDPGAAGTLDFTGGIGGRAGAPRAPYRFVKEDSAGTQAKVLVKDATGRTWSVKWGGEVPGEIFASRLAWAAGYFVEPLYYVDSGRITGAKKLGRAASHIDKKGRFEKARFELRGANGRYLEEYDWTWEKNPFLGTPQLNGLKTLLMMVSNWDNKDGRQGGGSNTGIFEQGSGPGRRWVYLVTDWGASMGKWGNVLRREKWNCEDFADQTEDFVKGVEDGEVKFGFSGNHSGGFKEGIRPSDAGWLMRQLGGVSDVQLRAGLRASGAADDEVDCFTRSLRARMNQLRRVADMR